MGGILYCSFVFVDPCAVFFRRKRGWNLARIESGAGGIWHRRNITHRHCRSVRPEFGNALETKETEERINSKGPGGPMFKARMQRATESQSGAKVHSTCHMPRSVHKKHGTDLRTAGEPSKFLFCACSISISCSISVPYFYIALTQIFSIGWMIPFSL